MALLTSEIVRLKHELGFNVLTVGAEPYVGIRAIFDQVIAAYMQSGATTTSATVVVASTSAAPVALTLASATGFAAMARVIVDVDDRQESATVQSVAGAVITVMLRNAHTGTYPVTVEGGEAIVRELLGRIASTKDQIADSFGGGALKQVDEVHFYQSGSKTQLGMLGEQLAFWRKELGRAVGLCPTNVGASGYEVY